MTPDQLGVLVRLASSRERLRAAMQSGATASTAGDAKAQDWTAALKEVPGAGLLLGALRGWWARHPLQVIGALALDAARALVQPIAKRHPVGLVLGAVVAGGLLAWTRPWRWVFTSAVLAGLLPQLAAKVLAQILDPRPSSSKDG